MAIHAKGLEKRFGRNPALRGIDLSIPGGSRVALLGPNGAGKSTLLRLVAGLSRPTSGHLSIAGLGAGKPAARQKVGLIAHETFLYPHLTARENLLFAGRLLGVPELGARVDKLLEEADLRHVANRTAGSFSRGMAQRLSIARALVHDPAVLLLDEPFSGLDGRASAKLAERLSELRQDDRTLLIVTHDLSRVAQVADSALILLNGRIAREIRGAALTSESLETLYAESTEGSP
ncbi:ABC transporter ATP-binding protein [Myxococcota bacterium]|nr:ABC transporter ATP-binding protein [Myxococcota bacterium]